MPTILSGKCGLRTKKSGVGRRWAQGGGVSPSVPPPIAFIHTQRYNTVMDDVSKQKYEKERLWVQTWQKAGKVLEALRRSEVRHVDTAEAILQLEDAFHSALRGIYSKLTIHTTLDMMNGPIFQVRDQVFMTGK